MLGRRAGGAAGFPRRRGALAPGSARKARAVWEGRGKKGQKRLSLHRSRLDEAAQAKVALAFRAFFCDKRLKKALGKNALTHRRAFAMNVPWKIAKRPPSFRNCPQSGATGPKRPRFLGFAAPWASGPRGLWRGTSFLRIRWFAILPSNDAVAPGLGGGVGDGGNPGK